MLSEKENTNTKTRHPQMIFYGGKGHCGYFNPAQHPSFGRVGLKFRSKELELEADIW